MQLVQAAPPSAARIILIGMAALAVAMGIGRFAFTPLLPLMLRDGTIDAASGTVWAAANYIGYLFGALTAARLFKRDPSRGMRLSLWGVAVTTFLAGAVAGPLAPLPGALLRLAAGVFSAWTLVCASSWCLTELARRDAAPRAAWVYTGVGAGICIAGLLAWLGGTQPARMLWLELALIATAGAMLTGVGRDEAAKPASIRKDRGALPVQKGLQHLGLVVCYGTFGFGYIVPATFLPAMAREQVADPLVFGLAWPLFGLAAALSVAAVGRWLAGWPRRKAWALSQATMALGTAVILFSQAMWALIASAVLVGGTFMVATMAGLQLARELSPENPTPLLGRMTVAFASGQIMGPLLVRGVGAAHISGHDALWWANAAATVLLILSAAWLALNTPSPFAAPRTSPP
jgi:MFS family permease